MAFADGAKAKVGAIRASVLASVRRWHLGKTEQPLFELLQTVDGGLLCNGSRERGRRERDPRRLACGIARRSPIGEEEVAANCAPPANPFGLASGRDFNYTKTTMYTSLSLTLSYRSGRARSQPSIWLDLFTSKPLSSTTPVPLSTWSPLDSAGALSRLIKPSRHLQCCREGS